MLYIAINFIYFRLGNANGLLYHFPFDFYRIESSLISLSFSRYISQLAALVFSYVVTFIEGLYECLDSRFSNFKVTIQTLLPYLQVIYSIGQY